MKTIQALFLIMIILLETGEMIHAQPVEPVNTLQVGSGYPGEEVDGIAGCTYNELQTTEIFNSTGWDDPADFTAIFGLSWDPYYLYVYAEITDDLAHNYEWGVGNPWEFDNFEIFLQLDTNTVTTSYSGTTIQLRVCRGLDSVESAGRAVRSDYLYYMEENAAGGWICEVAVPWTAVLAVGSVPEDFNDYRDAVIGFDFAACDSDNTDGDANVGNRDVQAAWDMDDPDDAGDRTEDLAWNNTSVFGYITLDGKWCYEYDNLSWQKEENMQIFPNPAEESIRLEGVHDISFLTLYDIRGQVILKSLYHPGQELDISGLESGLYVVVLDGRESITFVKR